MQLPEKAIKEFQEIYKKNFGKEISYDKASESARNLINLYKVLYDSEVEDLKRQKKLKEHPKGFNLEGEGYTCFICHQTISNQQAWYDKYGIKCPACQKAVNKRIIPGSIAKNKDSWYSTYDLESRFDINRHVLKHFIKEGILKPRIIKNESRGVHIYIFLIKDNKDTLPPKKLTESKLVKETKDGKEWFHSEPWHRFEGATEKVRNYKIMDTLRYQ